MHSVHAYVMALAASALVALASAVFATDYNDKAALTAEGTLTSSTRYYGGALYSDSACTTPTTINGPLLHGFVELHPNPVDTWVMARAVTSGSSSISECSLDYTLATASPVTLPSSFVIKCNSSNSSQYLFINYPNHNCSGEPQGVAPKDSETMKNMLTGKCFEAQLSDFGITGVYMKYNESVVDNSKQELCGEDSSSEMATSENGYVALAAMSDSSSEMATSDSSSEMAMMAVILLCVVGGLVVMVLAIYAGYKFFMTKKLMATLETSKSIELT